MTPAADSTTAQHVSAAGRNLPPLWFLAPEGFFALPLAATPEERSERALHFVRELYSRGDESIWEPAAPYYAAIAELMGDTGVSYAAMGLFSTVEEPDAPAGHVLRHEPAEGVAQCALTVAIAPTDQAGADTDVVAQGILATLSGDPYNDAIWLDLPCGPAVSCVTVREYSLSPELSATGEETKLRTGQIQVHVPFPTGPYTAIFTLYTASMDHWAEIYRLMSAVLQTVSFVDPAEDVADGSPEDDYEGA
ncbi:hypothetical protein [Streptomyces lomondensis]|uniref:Uncharacterized protein n=1 Tax=Streptomyces lomondensis TaxID=68229 RepID=A0ABQ2X1N2_9ACTN|nr:hypothetical protein [Streptomyces lomondensis]MCF0081632.1 hypothetical protein [Streptomyces lomondensis]GGW92217.1 hypothetical protein GCM10010383_22600 [Streptomyces lomondensis]